MISASLVFISYFSCLIFIVLCQSLSFLNRPNLLLKSGKCWASTSSEANWFVLLSRSVKYLSFLKSLKFWWYQCKGAFKTDDSALHRDWFWRDVSPKQTAGSVTVKHSWRAGVLSHCYQCSSIFVADASGKPLVKILPF